MIKENSYFDGNVKSLGYATSIGNSTVGVMQAGMYDFSTGSPEIMTVIEGNMLVQMEGNEEWLGYGPGESYHVPGNSSFKVMIEVQTSYLCQF